MSSSRTPRRSAFATWSWILGAALFVAVVTAGVRVSEGHAFLELARRARRSWLWLAIASQAVTYLLQAQVWRVVARKAQRPLSMRTAYELSLAKQFVDQALPSAGVSSSVLLAATLDRQHMPRPIAMAIVAVNLVTYHTAYLIGLAAAMGIAVMHGWTTSLTIFLAGMFGVFAVGLTAVVLAFAGRPAPVRVGTIATYSPIRRVLQFVQDADRRLVGSPTVLVETTMLQLGIIACDTLSMTALVRALGADSPVSAVFVGLMVACLVRTMGVVPGGLGTFEAAGIVTLHMTGMSVPVAVAATLLFRGLSFWLPMLPGWWCSRRVLRTPVGPPTPSMGAYWATPAADLLHDLRSNPGGLSDADATARAAVAGPGDVFDHPSFSRTRVLLRQVSSPLAWLLVGAASISLAMREWTDAGIVLAIVLATVVVGFLRESRAEVAVAALTARTRTMATVLRDGVPASVPRSALVPGDVVQLSAGSLVPADGVVLDATDCFVSEAALTGESFPVQKRPGVLEASAGIAARSNCVFLGTNVRSGTARCLVVATGRSTELATIAAHLTRRAPETDFDRGIRRFGYLMTSTMLLIVLAVFVAHVLRGRPPVETLLFSVALAVGLNPELLPAILTINLARGAQMMATRGVLVRRLNAIENLGSMTVLCTDKTGTLTEGIVRLDGAWGPDGAAAPTVLATAALNAGLQAGLANPLDDAILAAAPSDLAGTAKVAEIPFDFSRKRLSVIVSTPDGAQLITKGAFASILSICTRTTAGDVLDPRRIADVTARHDDWSREGTRVIAVATRHVAAKAVYDRHDETDMELAGFVTFLDRPKQGAKAAIHDLARLGVAVKLVTGDHQLVARHVATSIGMRGDRLLTGTDLRALDEAALWRLVSDTEVFAEVDPDQKERIIRALRKRGAIVGFLGDGINDAPAMHAADTSLSVEGAVDVARETADFVLLDRDLDVIRRGVEEGRRTFANTMKYILTTTSANVGNMLSMAAASLMLPFLPLTAGQILLNNLLSDIPAVGIADDSVDAALVARPPRWDMAFIGRFMGEFGVLSSCFDALTFVVLLRGFHASPELFRTGWFVESLLTELAVALVVRTRGSVFSSRPGRLLLWSSMTMIAITPAIPFLPFAGALGFVRLPASVLLTVCAITMLYVLSAEGLKRRFYRHPAR